MTSDVQYLSHSEREREIERERDRDDLTNQNAASEGSHMTWTSKGEWSVPSFTYRQNDESSVCSSLPVH